MSFTSGVNTSTSSSSNGSEPLNNLYVKRPKCGLHYLVLEVSTLGPYTKLL